MKNNYSWKLLSRNKAYSSKFLNVYEDKVMLPNGTIINDYTVVKMPDIVMVVATDKKENIIILEEYKYAVGKTMLTLPAGQLEDRENPLETAKRELLEETGYGGGEFEKIGILYDYPTKDLHKVIVVRAKNVIKNKDVSHEKTENISCFAVSRTELNKQIKERKWQASGALAALVLCGMIS